MEIVTETPRGTRYKPRMMGVLISGPSYIYGDKMSFVHNTQYPESTLNKRSNYICYYAVSESVAMGESLTGNFGNKEDCADLVSGVG